jgi:hypothetical protein
LYGRCQFQSSGDLTWFKFARQIKAAFPGLTEKQKKTDGCPVLVFCGCKLAKNPERAATGGGK